MECLEAVVVIALFLFGSLQLYSKNSRVTFQIIASRRSYYVTAERGPYLVALG